ncbi:hypothetical protein WMF31_38870 [Sorangium sp. So ce1036]|uniref:DISARM system helicase DrmA n=1 Tax=Sorangium sp. So ce1036 TaxID=3133328 RepID=UPI003F0C216A
MPSSTDVRAGLVAALEADLVGPFAPGTPAGAAEELLPLPPSRWYLTGFLAPQADRETHDPTADDEFTQAGEDDDEESSPPELEPKQKNHFPASMGLSVLLPRDPGEPETVRAMVTFAEYVREEQKTDEPRRRKVVWRRVPQPPRSVELPLDARAIEEGLPLPDTPGIQVCGKLEPADAPGLSGTRALSLFVVNRRQPGERGQQDAQFIFQVELELHYARGFVPRPNRKGEGAPDPDDRVADLQFRAHCEWAVGHGVAVEAPDGQRSVTTLRTTWIPRYEVRRVKTRKDERVVTRMEELAELAARALEDGAAADGRPGAAVAAALQPLVEAYTAWIGDQANIPLDSSRREETRKLLVIKPARRACARIQAGIDLLARDREVLEAFGLMNKAMAQAALQRNPDRYGKDKRPTWHLFQLAFVLLNLAGIADETHEDREQVELIFFPTGGGKTEAYLGVIGFTLLLRRLRGRRRPDGGLGVAVLLRYTLRLLTLDQLGRAATLVCALELLRKQHPEKLGQVRFAVGLWVGRSATANTLEQVKKLVIEYKNSSSKSASSPFPLTNCPWCGRRLGRDSLVLAPSRTAPEEVVVSCVTPSGEPPSDCAFSPRNNAEGLPVLFVDEQIYRELPAFLVATVDKFAMLPWRGETGMLFGRAAAREGKKFHGPMDRPPKGAAPLPSGLLPPELIVQDELHLIAGPLGTMVGLYETAIEHLSSRPGGAKPVPPKVIASTATLRRAREQIRALFGREQMALFPPPGVDHAETFFATLDRTSPRTAVRRRRRARAAAEGDLAAHVRGAARRGAGAVRPEGRGRSAGRPLHDAGGLLQQLARARRHAAAGRGRRAHARRDDRAARARGPRGAAPVGAEPGDLDARRAHLPREGRRHQGGQGPPRGRPHREGARRRPPREQHDLRRRRHRPARADGDRGSARGLRKVPCSTTPPTASSAPISRAHERIRGLRWPRAQAPPRRPRRARALTGVHGGQRALQRAADGPVARHVRSRLRRQRGAGGGAARGPLPGGRLRPQGVLPGRVRGAPLRGPRRGRGDRALA